MNVAEFIRENKAYFEDFVTRSTYNSNRIEGNTLSYAETYAIIFNDNSFMVKTKPREIYEAINHKYALSYVLEHLGENLSERMIKDIGVQINKNINEIDGYRKIQVIINKAEFLPPLPEQVGLQMMHFVDNYNNTEYDSVFEKMADMHIKFERIHPFEDGNGRTGRLLITYECLKQDVAPAIIPADDRREYFEFLATGDAQGFAGYLERLSGEEQERVGVFKKLNE